MNATKLVLAGILGTILVVTSGIGTASAAPPHAPARRGYYHGGYWHRPYYYSYGYGYPAYSYAYAPPCAGYPVAYSYPPGYWNSGVFVGVPGVGIRIGR